MSTKLEKFIEAIHQLKLLEITFITNQDDSIRVRTCVPFDYAPSSKDKLKVDKYQLYDLDSPNGRHNLAIVEEQIIDIRILNHIFEPKDYITWKFIPHSWKISRDWGEFS